MCAVLGDNPGIYKALRRVQTSSGVGLAPCIKSGMDDRGYPTAMSIGLMAGDEECYTTFSALFDPVIARLHGAPASGSLQAALAPLDLAALSRMQLDEDGTHVLAVRVDLRRNLGGLRFLPCSSQAERRDVEQLLVQGMLRLGSGDYLPLPWSESFLPKPGGMSREEESRLRNEGLLFSEPSTVAQLAASLGRDWPDARGVFAADQRGLHVWCNEEDHLRFVASQEGGDLQGAFIRAIQSAEGFEEEVKRNGCKGFARNERLGIVTASPEHLGTGLRCTVTVRLPQLGSRGCVTKLCEALHLEATWKSSMGAWDVANRPTLQPSQADLVNSVVVSCARLVRLERQIETGCAVDGEFEELLAARG